MKGESAEEVLKKIKKENKRLKIKAKNYKIDIFVELG